MASSFFSLKNEVTNYRMKYIIPSLLVLFLILIFYPKDYDEVNSTIYIDTNKHYNLYDRQRVYSDSDTTAIQTNSGRTPNYGGEETGGWVMPVSSSEGFHITSLIGYRLLSGTTPKYHRGFDFSNGKSGSAVVSIGDGSIVDIKSNPNNSSGFGICVTVRYHSSNIGNFCVIYAHLGSYDTSISVGSAVKKGQEIGKVGNSGMSTDPHLHWQAFYGVKYGDLNNSFNPFQVLYPVDNKTAAITQKYGVIFYEPAEYVAENAFYSEYAKNKTKYANFYKENQKLGVLPEDFFE